MSYAAYIATLYLGMQGLFSACLGGIVMTKVVTNDDMSPRPIWAVIGSFLTLVGGFSFIVAGCVILM